MPKKKSTPQHDAVLKILVQLLGVGTFTLIAGISDDVGKLVVTFMAGIMIIWAFLHVANMQKMVSKL